MCRFVCRGRFCGLWNLYEKQSIMHYFMVLGSQNYTHPQNSTINNSRRNPRLKNSTHAPASEQLLSSCLALKIESLKGEDHSSLYTLLSYTKTSYSAVSYNTTAIFLANKALKTLGVDPYNSGLRRSMERSFCCLMGKRIAFQCRALGVG